MRVKQSFMNPQQLAIYESKQGREKMKEAWKKEIINVKMMNDLLKDSMLDLNRDMNLLFQQTYNFENRQEKVPQWIKDREEQQAIEKLNKANTKEEERRELEAYRNKVLKNMGAKTFQPIVPFGVYFKQRPDANGNFNISQLPKETYEPPPTPKGSLRQDINFLTAEMQYEIKHKHVSKLEVLLKTAYEIAPGELENIICQAELVIK